MQAVGVKTQQKEMQTAALELGPCACICFVVILSLNVRRRRTN
jgi:hypothetical protein